jgi:hypothetical protein
MAPPTAKGFLARRTGSAFAHRVVISREVARLTEQVGFEMKQRKLRRWLKLLLWGFAAWILLKTGLYVSPAAAASMPSTNAFLFLFGLSSALVLLSPPASRQYRYRLR